MDTWLVNSFSLNMVVPEAVAELSFERLTFEAATQVARGARSAVGHADTAALLSSLLSRSGRAIARSSPSTRGLGSPRGPRASRRARRSRGSS